MSIDIIWLKNQQLCVCVWVNGEHKIIFVNKHCAFLTKPVYLMFILILISNVCGLHPRFAHVNFIRNVIISNHLKIVIIQKKLDRQHV